jgi:hypothetical protein
MSYCGVFVFVSIVMSNTCCVVGFFLFFCLRFVSCLANVASISVLSFLDFPFDFSDVYLIKLIQNMIYITGVFQAIKYKT